MNNILERIHTMLKVLNDNIVIERKEIANVKYERCDYKVKTVFPNTDNMKPFYGQWKTKKDDHAWFYFEANIPKEDKYTYSRIKFDTDKDGWDATNPQFLVYNGQKALQSLDTNHRYIELGSGRKRVYVYGYSGMNDVDTIKFQPVIETICEPVERLYFDICPLLDILLSDRSLDKEYIDLLMSLNDTLNIVNFRDLRSDDFYESAAVAHEFLSSKFFSKPEKIKNSSVSLIGHTHIDIAWLWTKLQTREKAQRSFSTVLSLMDKFPSYKFMSSQPYLYQAVKEENPELYKRIQEKVKEGRWEVEGAMWVEADCNITSGESLIRQILYGKKFMMDEFDVDSKILWLPDVFGYSYCLPQILKKCGVNTFVTSKISWNDTNMMPYDMFDWYGLDGSKVFTYFITSSEAKPGNNIEKFTNYNGNPTPKWVEGTYKRMQQKELTDEALMPYGFGDGGGGPTREYLENIERLKYGLPYTPNVKNEFAGSFLKRVEKKARTREVPSWKGELYLEFHRGTYTSIAKNKNYNRRSEFLMENLENLAVITSSKIDKKWYDDNWKMILTNQFHDIIPGSSIKEVYDESDKEYQKFFKEGNALLNDYLKTLALNSKYKLNVYNPNSFKMSGYFKKDNNYYFVEDCPSKGFKGVELKPSLDKVKVNKKSLDNPFYKITFDDEFKIVSIIDKLNDRELLKDKAEIKVYENFPQVHDAWEIRNYYTEKSYSLVFDKAEKFDYNSKKGFRVYSHHYNSNFIVEIGLYDESPRIDFDCKLDLNTDESLVKALFPLDINSTVAKCDIQFGVADRPTHSNTSWDKAKFEVCAQKYVDISEGNFGVALLNENKYGYSIKDNVLGLSLLKTSLDPNNGVDKGVHEFTFSLMSHAGELKDSSVIKEAYLLNNPFILFEGDQKGKNTEDSFVSLNKDNVFLDTIKYSENDESIIMRLYETLNINTNLTLSFKEHYKHIYLCDMLENNLEELTYSGVKLSLKVKPFEIVTLKLVK